MWFRFLGVLVFLGVCLYRLTLRIRMVGEENREKAVASGRPFLYALWHQRMVAGILSQRWRGLVTMASKSRDGQIISTFLGLWGFKVVRGSSSRAGGPASAHFLRLLGSGSGGAALTPDGPRGPARRSKPGIVFLAERSGAAILPVGSSSTRPWFARSWDRFLVPLPFSRCVVRIGEPVERQPDETDESLLRRIDAAIDARTDEADRLCCVPGAPRGRETKEATESASDDDG
jgi:lysophospholipid acyltransferase (LPLAT)-like uncharacterized protein